MVKEKNYLFSVLGLSAIPRIITSLLTFICFPLMIRSLGANNYGLVIYFMAIISILESLVDFGVSSAAGKAIAEARIQAPTLLKYIVKRWGRLQLVMAILGFFPLIGITYLVSYSKNTEFSVELLILLVLSSWVAISLNFIRATLNSLLAFKYIAFLDTSESIVRSVSWLIVAFFFSSPIGLAWAQLCTAILTSCLAFILINLVLRKSSLHTSISEIQVSPSMYHMLKESINFLWLRLITRLFQAVPVFILGKLFGTGIVGIFGAFQKITEIINFPFSIIGNAIAVKAHGIVVNGIEAVMKVWDMVSRLIIIAITSTLTVIIGASIISEFLLPGNKDAIVFIRILSISILSNALSAIITPMSDYVGALKSRNILMTLFTGVLLVSIYLAGFFNGEITAMITYIVILLLMNMGYIIIAKKAFFRDVKYYPKKEFFVLILVSLAAFSLTLLFKSYIDFHPEQYKYFKTIISVVFFWILILLTVVSFKSLRKYIFTRQFLDLH